jgi:arylformamidase
MDRAQLDIAYNNTLAVPERGEIVADWAARSDRMRQKYGGVLDLRYGDTPRERLDLFRGADPKAPTLAFIHGGCWPGNDKEDYAFLGGGILLDRIVAEIRRAALWLAEHLGDYGADPDQLYVSGHSAGGYLTAMTMPLDVVRGGIAICGIYDLEPIRLDYLNERLGLDPAEAAPQQPAVAFPAAGSRTRHSVWDTRVARVVPPVHRIRSGVDRARSFRPSAADRRRQPLHDPGSPRAGLRHVDVRATRYDRRLSKPRPPPLTGASVGPVRPSPKNGVILLAG